MTSTNVTKLANTKTAGGRLDMVSHAAITSNEMHLLDYYVNSSLLTIVDEYAIVNTHELGKCKLEYCGQNTRGSSRCENYSEHDSCNGHATYTIPLCTKARNLPLRKTTYTVKRLLHVGDVPRQRSFTVGMSLDAERVFSVTCDRTPLMKECENTWLLLTLASAISLDHSIHLKVDNRASYPKEVGMVNVARLTMHCNIGGSAWKRKRAMQEDAVASTTGTGTTTIVGYNTVACSPSKRTKAGGMTLTDHVEYLAKKHEIPHVRNGSISLLVCTEVMNSRLVKAMSQCQEYTNHMWKLTREHSLSGYTVVVANAFSYCDGSVSSRVVGELRIDVPSLEEHATLVNRALNIRGMRTITIDGERFLLIPRCIPSRKGEYRSMDTQILSKARLISSRDSNIALIDYRFETDDSVQKTPAVFTDLNDRPLRDVMIIENIRSRLPVTNELAKMFDEHLYMVPSSLKQDSGENNGDNNHKNSENSYMCYAIRINMNPFLDGGGLYLRLGNLMDWSTSIPRCQDSLSRGLCCRYVSEEVDNCNQYLMNDTREFHQLFFDCEALDSKVKENMKRLLGDIE